MSLTYLLRADVRDLMKIIYARSLYWFDVNKAMLPQIALDEQFTVSLATQQQDFEGAFKLLHDDLVGKKLSRPNPSGLKLNIHSVMPQNSTLIVRYRDLVVAAATLIQDSQLGFPGEKFYPNEVQELRQRYRYGIVELSNVVIDQAFKAHQLAFFHLFMKYAMNLCRRNLKSQALFITINPVLQEYFRKSWGFQVMGPNLRYNSNPQAQISMAVCDLRSSPRRVQLHKTPSKDLRRNISLFVRKRDLRFSYPVRSEGQRMNGVMTAAMIEDFCLIKTGLYEELDTHSRQIFLEMYLQFFGHENLRSFVETEVTLNLKEFRLPVDTQVAIKCGEQFYVGAIRDISQSGCYVELPNELLDSRGNITLTFHLGQNEMRLDAKPIWRNLDRNSKYRQGYGIQFDRPIMDLQEQINDWTSTNVKTRVLRAA